MGVYPILLELLVFAVKKTGIGFATAQCHVTPHVKLCFCFVLLRLLLLLGMVERVRRCFFVLFFPPLYLAFFAATGWE